MKVMADTENGGNGSGKKQKKQQDKKHHRSVHDGVHNDILFPFVVKRKKLFQDQEDLRDTESG
jgi:hypothetical protein